ncbi:MAG: dTDP-4-dehydrorhamnose 3,5-epimerase family protein [Azospirillaceae bacterium]
MTTERLPDGCALIPLTTHHDERGSLTEIFRAEWPTCIRPVQWNFVRSRPNVLRGVHVHVEHDDYLVCLSGLMVLALVDIRPDSATHGLAATVTLDPAAPRAAFIPTGVAHGFHFPVESSLCYSVSHYWNPRDELGCRWDDPALGLDWRIDAPELSERDRAAGSFQVMVDAFLDLADRHQAAR